MLWLLVISCVAIAIYGSRHAWAPTRETVLPKRCAACRRMSPRAAQKCCYCHEWFPVAAASLLLLLIVGVQVSAAQGINLVPCPGINFFGEACETEIEAEPVRMVSPPVAPPMPPLFRKDEMAHDTPQLMLELLQNPTPEAAKRFVAWQAQRMKVMELSQRLIQQETLKQEVQ